MIRLNLTASLSRLITIAGTAALAAVSPIMHPNRARAAEAPVSYENAIAQLKAVIETELSRKIVSGFSIALVDDQRVVFLGGFGLADKQKNLSANADTVYRAGSISKLFTALAAMQLVEQGKLNLDEPITTYLPEFRIRPASRSDKPITLRQLMSHRSGMIRESPVGSYFDDSEPGAEKTIASIAQTTLVHPPETKTIYSNVGPTIVGLTIQRVAGIPFEQYQREKIFAPMGMKSSAWLYRDIPGGKLSNSYMRVADARGSFFEIAAPQFDLGTLPAGNLFTTAGDLASFASMLLAGGKTTSGAQLISVDSLNQMFTPQLTSETKGFGLGFSIGEFRGRKTVQHMGAVYGFTSSLIVLPKEKLAVVVLGNEDIAIGPVTRLAHAGLSALLEGKFGEKAPANPTFKHSPADLDVFAGHYESESYWAELTVKDGLVHANISSQPMVLSAREPLKFEAYGRYVHQSPFVFEKDVNGKVVSFTALTQKFTRIDPAAAPEPDKQWQPLLGSYGKSFIPLVVSIRHGRLYAMTENMFDYRVHPVNATTFKMPPGLYTDEHIVFSLTPDGRCNSLVMANVRMDRIEQRTHTSPGAAGPDQSNNPAVGAQQANVGAPPPPWTLISRDNVWPIWALVLAGTATAIYLEQNFTWAAKISGPVLALLIAMALSNLRIVPGESQVNEVVGNYFVPLAIPLLLFRANLFEIVRTTGSLFGAVQIAIAGTLIGTFVAAFAFRGKLDQLPETSGIMAASFIGGGVNFFAVKQHYGVSENITGPLLVADNVIMAGAFLLLFAISDLPFFRRFFRHPHSASADADAAALAAKHWERKPIALIDIARGLAFAIAITATAQMIASWIGNAGKAEAGDEKRRLVWAIMQSVLASKYVWITLVAVLAATLFPRMLAGIHGAQEIGGYLLYLFLFVIGLPADLLLVLKSVPSMFLFCGIIAIINILVLLVFGYATRMKLEDLLLASNATLGGPPTAAAMAISKGWHRLVLPGLLIGLWGYIVGTFLGIVVVETLRRM